MAKQKQQTYSQEEINNIKNYGNEIISLNSFVEYVRQTPDVYLGPIGDEGYMTMCRETIQNSIDEANRVKSVCNTIIVSFDQRSKALIVQDNGRGFPHGKMIQMVSQDHTSSNYKKGKGEYTSGKNGMGLKIVNAMSIKTIVESSILGVAHRIEFDDGIPWSKGEKVVKSDIYQGSLVMFIPSTECLGPISVTWQRVHFLLSLLTPLSRPGTTIIFNAIDENGNEHHDTFVSKNGIADLLNERTKSPLISPIHIFADTGEMRANIMLTYDADQDEIDPIISFNNYCPTIGGTHVDGFTQGLCNFFRKDMNDIFLSGSKTKTVVINQDILFGLRAVVNTDMLEPLYHGQSKNMLSNQEMKPFTSAVTIEGLQKWSRENPRDLQILRKFFKEIADARIKTDSAKTKITNNFKKNVVGNVNLPANYKKPIVAKKELLIVEGDSAAGTAGDARDTNIQGVVGIRGKFPNAMKKSLKDIQNNQEAAGLIAILDDGKGENYQRPGYKYNVDLCPFEKVIITTDADVDGKGHIRPLLFKFFLVYMPGLILDGRLYAATPPLYGAKVGRKTIYFSDDMELSRYLLKEFLKEHTISTVDGHKMTTIEISQLLIKNINYISMVDSMYRTFAIDPILLEMILNNYKKGYTHLRKKLESTYRFVTVDKVGKSIVIECVFNNKTHTVVIDDELICNCTPLIEQMAMSDEHYVIDGKKTSLYETLTLFNRYRPNNIKRYKGLGEMDADELADSTVLPTGNRILLRYNMEDIKREIQQIRAIESDFSVLLKTIRG